MPVLAIVGQQSRDAIGGHYQQEVDLVSLFKDVAGAFSCSRRLRPPRCAI
jgi:pyruvate dehydrogenase (quinone)